MKEFDEKAMIDDLKIDEARNSIKSKIGQHVHLLIKEVHRSALIAKEGVISGAYDNLFTIKQFVNKFYSEEKSYTYKDFLTGKVQFK